MNLVLIWLVNGWPGWQAVPFLTAETAQVVVPVTISFGVAALANLANLVFDRRWLRAVGELVSAGFALFAVIRIWAVFPFTFTDPVVPWELIFRVALGFAIAGCVISCIVQVVVLVRLAAGGSPTRRGSIRN